MRRRSILRGARRWWALVLLVTLGFSGSGWPALACYDTTATDSRAKNLVVFVLDGFGFGAQSLARLTLAGPDNRLRMENLPFFGVMSLYGRTSLATDKDSALWSLIWGLKADAGETRPPRAAERASWLQVARDGKRAVGLVTDGRLDEDAWPLGALAQPGSGSPKPDWQRLAVSPPDFLFGRVSQQVDWSGVTGALAGAPVKTLAGWDAPVSETDRAWYLWPGNPANPLAGEVSPSLAQVTERAMERLGRNPDGFVLMVHASELGRAIRAHDLGLTAAHLGLVDEAIGSALAFAEKGEGTAVVVLSTGDPAGLTLLDDFSPRRLDQVQQSLAEVAARVRTAPTLREGVEIIRQGLGLEVGEGDLAAWQGLDQDGLAAVLGEKVALGVGVRFNPSGASINPVPVMAYGPGAWVYGRMIDATEVPSLVVAQLWLDPSTLAQGAK